MIILIKCAYGQVQCGGDLLSLFIIQSYYMQNANLQIDM